MTAERIINKLLKIELKNTARKLGFIEQEKRLVPSKNLLHFALGLIDELSRNNSEVNKKAVVTLCALLWTYKRKEWDGLKDIIILVLSRIGYGPSAIMVDDEYNYESKQHSGMNSIINELSTTVHHINNEVTIADKTFLLTAFQKNIWDKIDYNKILGISAPTSAGKSFIILLKSMDLLLERDGTIIYIVPTLSLVSQVSADFRQQLEFFGLTDYEVMTGYAGNYDNDKKIFVLTQERAIAAFSQNNEPFKNIRLLVADEIQNVERVANENDQRAKTLYDLLIDFRFQTKPDYIIISGPRIEGIGNLGDIIFGEDTEQEEAKSSPVVNITYSIEKQKDNFYFKLYSDLVDTPLEIKINDNIDIGGYGKALYSDGYHEFLATFIYNLGKSKNIIFSPTSRQARITALKLHELATEVPKNNKLQSLVEYIRSTVHYNYDLCRTLESGVAYHHGKIPTHVRRVTEQAIKDKIIDNVVCTTTLMQGVNLPAQNVIVRTPKLYVVRQRHKENAKLTNYEMANLRGRAGRLLKDFIGRTFVLDEDSFKESEVIDDLFEDASKSLDAGYGGTFNNNYNEIIEGLEEQEVPREDNKEYSFIMTYIRQTVLKHGDFAHPRLRAVGIDLPGENFVSLTKQLSELTVPKDICFRNRYWDPFDLERLYQMSKYIYAETGFPCSDSARHLNDLINILKKHFPVYYGRYFGINHIGSIFSTSIKAIDWMKEKPLVDILDDKYYDDDSEKIDKAIESLNNKISYGLTTLLKPLYDIKDPESMFLTFMEMGAYRPVTRHLIELNIPRETAISLSDRIGTIDKDGIVDSNNLMYNLKQIYNDLPYWEQVQLDSIV